MPTDIQDQAEFDKSLEAAGESTTGAQHVVLTGNPDIDLLLEQFSTSAAFDKTMVYVYTNLSPRPKLNIADKKRMIYAVKGAYFYYEYSLTDLDIAWLARALQGEGKALASLRCWTWLNRFMLNPSRKQNWDNCFWKCVVYHAQSISPLWRRTGSKCTEGSIYYKTDRCSPARLNKRDRNAYGPINKDAQKLAEQFAIGDLAAPAKVYTDFAMTSENSHWKEDGGDLFGNEAFYPITSKWKRPNWDILLKGTKSTASTIPKTLRPVKTEDLIPEVNPGQLIAYIRQQLIREHDDLQKRGLTRGNFSIAARLEAQGSADAKGQQIANTVQTLTSLNNSKGASPGTPEVGPNGQQVCSDDTWNYV